MRLILAAALLAASVGAAQAACSCQCVGGTMQPICSNTFEIPPPCIGICPIAPPVIPPLPSLNLPPLGTSQCQYEQVWTGTRYEFRNLCR